MADMSWWPKHSAWKNSGLDWGYWTPVCEAWFQGWLHQIASGRGLKTAAEWKEVLKFQKYMLKVVEGNRWDSAAFIRNAH
jgi:hypothetical protein